MFSKLDKFSYTILKEIVGCFGVFIHKDIKSTNNYISFLLLLTPLFVLISGLDTMARNSDKGIEKSYGNRHTCFFFWSQKKSPQSFYQQDFCFYFGR